MLSLWAYPNVFRPTGKPSFPSREVADVVAIFGNDILCFSDKEIEFQTDVDPLLAWRRWYREAVEESAKQLIGARRYLLRDDVTLYQDEKCLSPLPLVIPPVSERRIHLVVVANGARQACIDRMGGGGFQMVTNKVVAPNDPQPFILFQPFSRHFVHVLDDTALRFLMFHVDTAPDLVHYLAEREKFLARPHAVYFQGGECDLFLSYLGSC